MTGKDLLEKLQQFTPEQLEFPVCLDTSDENWVYIDELRPEQVNFVRDEQYCPIQGNSVKGDCIIIGG